MVSTASSLLKPANISRWLLGAPVGPLRPDDASVIIFSSVVLFKFVIQVLAKIFYLRNLPSRFANLRLSNNLPDGLP